MQCMLNFSGEDRRELLLFLKQFPKKQTKSGFEQLRCSVGKTTVTLYKSGKLLLQGSDCSKAKEKILKAIEKEEEPILGIDEAGRGEGFGPFVVAGVLARPASMREVRDSKKTANLDAKRKTVEGNAAAIAVFSVSSKGLGELHERGISLNTVEANAINAMHDFFTGKSAKTLVDGLPLKGCRPGIEFIPKGDDLNPVIGAASVVAKSERQDSKDAGKRAGWGTWSKKGGR